MHKILWLIDIGNSSITLAQKVGKKVHSLTEFDDDNIPKLCQKIEKSGSASEKTVVICSVVPKNEKIVLKSLRAFNNINILRVGHEIPVNINSKYKYYNRLGNDRKVNMYGALRFYRPPFLIFDLGTATSIDYVSSYGVFEGGMIFPGAKLCLNLLHEKTALLPAVRIRPTKVFLGRDTRSCMLSGVLRGYGAMVDGLIEQFKKRYGSNLKAIATGGLADIVSKYSDKIDKVDPELTLRSIAQVYEDLDLNKMKRKIERKSHGR